MIWFPCKQCGKTHGRPEELSGTLVFCDCGEGNRVPWSSTAPEPAAPPEESPPAPPPPPRRPRREPDGPRPTPRHWRRDREPARPDPNRCLNHEDRPREATCDECRESFCAACVVTLEGKTVCGPCKDYRARAVRRPPRVSGMAVASCLLALVVAGPVSFCLPMIVVGNQVEGESIAGAVPIFGLFAIILPLTALVLGLLALRDIETNRNVSGRPVALTGTIAAGVGVLWCLVVFTAVAFKHGG
jgi:hypothetical protein